jgi:hypothetical protein
MNQKRETKQLEHKKARQNEYNDYAVMLDTSSLLLLGIISYA